MHDVQTEHDGLVTPTSNSSGLGVLVVSQQLPLSHYRPRSHCYGQTATPRGHALDVTIKHLEGRTGRPACTYSQNWVGSHVSGGSRGGLQGLAAPPQWKLAPLRLRRRGALGAGR